VPANNLKELVALSKQKPLNFAISGTGGANHLAGVAVQRALDARWEYVPYKGGSQAIQDTVAGQTQVMMNGMLATLPHVQSGKLKLLAVSKRTRMPLIGNVPTVAEQGLPGFESGTWQGVLAPKGTPEAIVQRLNAELVRAIRNPSVRANLAGQGAEVVTMSPSEEDQFFAQERKRWGDVVNAAHIRAE
jgi:tripartite-type tricarboxylate transporter receptor subunit TctC